ncbi:TPA: hypothetical protein GF725_10090 [Escherichia coli]|uniref:terminase small subunit-like protein n=1 Tax=Escherichia coli TaxID=562 RepID=UPI000B42770F|nr:hypothetical protein [Escherichia coli]OWF05376.1 hypothetical protein A8M74_03895 [Escherichia coli]RCO13111.1 hypothetical protein BEA14_15645 [Escherichia coli]HAH2556697.1 hypothetical protein [Escherichia coli]HAI0721133.1 hypothetical protein [Escherichia coli]
MEGELIQNNELDIFVTSETQKKRGRPTKYSEKLATQIILLVSEGCSLRKISKMPGMPSYPAMMRWQWEHMEFREGIAWMSWLWCAEAGRLAVEIIDEVNITAEDGTKQLRKAEAKAKALLAAAKLNDLKSSPFGDKKQ